MTLAFICGAAWRDHDTDLPLLLAAAAERGVEASIEVWDDPHVDWSAFETAVVRSCWDYIDRRDEFLAWAASVPHLRNDAATLAWNTDKVYLRELEAAGVPVIETRWDIGAGDDLGDHREWVVKPAISAGSRDTARWTDPADVYAHSEALRAAGHVTMTQPYIASVDDEGETALLWFGGTFSHAIRKGAMLAPGTGAHAEPQMREHITPREPSHEQLAVARQALETATSILARQPLYARVDLVTGPAGEPRLIELELAEPSLFLEHAPGAAARLVEAAVS